MSWMKRQRLLGWVFIGPNLLGITLFLFLPACFSFYLMFTDWVFSSGQAPKFIGFHNFARMFHEGLFYTALKNTLLILVPVPVCIILSFVLSVFLNDKVYFKRFLRAAFFAPYFTSGIAVSFVWMVLFQPTTGPINQFLRSIGIANPPQWLASPDTSIYAIMIMMILGAVGYNMVIYLAALQDVSRDLYEAAKIDGARFGHMIRYITFPLVSPTTFFLLITGFIGAIKSFGNIYAITGGGPADSTTVLSIFVYKQAFTFYEMGYASAISWIMFLFIFLITFIQWYGQRKWVHY